MADRIAVMDQGDVLQVAPPAELYEYPNCRFVADFIGKMNLFDGTVAGVRDGRVLVRVGALADQVGDLELPHAAQASGDVGIAVRPEKIRLYGDEPGDEPVRLKARVSEVVYYGDESHVFLETGSGARFAANLKNDSRDTHAGIVSGEEVWVSWRPEDTLVLTS